MKNKILLTLYLVTIFFFLIGCLPFTNLANVVHSKIVGESRLVTLSKEIGTETLETNGDGHAENSSGTTSEPYPGNNNNNGIVPSSPSQQIADQPYPSTNEGSWQSEANQPNPYPDNSVLATPDQNGNPYPGGTESAATSTRPYFQPTATQTTNNPYPMSTATLTPSISLTSTIQPTEESYPLSTPTSIPTIVKIDFHVMNPETVTLASGKLQLVEFFAYWCGTCRSMSPYMNELESEYKHMMNFVFLDIDDPATGLLKEALGYKMQPHIFLLDENGVILKQWVGYATKEELESSIKKYLH